VLDLPELASILDDAPLAYLAVESEGGPMVTPLLFAVRDGRIWMVMPRSSAKVGAIGRNAVVGLAAGAPGAMAVLQGNAHLVDPMRPQSMLGSLSETFLSPRAMTSFVAGNLDHLAGLVGPGVLSPRTAAALRPQRAAAVRAGEPLWTTGNWPGGAPPYGERDGAPPTLPLGPVPPELAGLVADPADVLVGWSTPTGPVVLPGRWNPEGRHATVRTDLFVATGCLPQARACVLFDATQGTSLDGKVGLVVRGRGSAHEGAGDGIAHLTIRAERYSWWQGEESRSAKAG
jgi:hypothetical protein